MDYLRRKNYEVVSAGAAAVESIAKPVAEQTHRLVVEGSETVYAGVVSVLDQVEKGSGSKLTWVRNYTADQPTEAGLSLGAAERHCRPGVPPRNRHADLGPDRGRPHPAARAVRGGIQGKRGGSGRELGVFFGKQDIY